MCNEMTSIAMSTYALGIYTKKKIVERRRFWEQLLLTNIGK